MPNVAGVKRHATQNEGYQTRINRALREEEANVADEYSYNGCLFRISQADGWFHVKYVGWMGMHYVGKARSWEAATGMAREYARTRV
jgi:hypothetical protein